MYILLTGAPGSKWSSVAENIYWSDSIDHTDYTEQRCYKKSGMVKHVGAYWDPGMEFDNTDWDGPFTGKGTRLIKSHTFTHQLDTLKQTGHPIVMVYRNDYECYKWWIAAGGFGISYPDYKHFQDLDEMWVHIQKENSDLLEFVKNNDSRIESPADNVDLCRMLGINFPDTKGRIHNYAQNDIKVYVYS